MSYKPQIILVDDHLLFRQSLKSILDIEEIAVVIEEASNGLEFMELLSKCRPDLVIMDIDMPYMNGIEATQKALEIMPELKIIAFTMFGEEEYYHIMIGLGVKGFIIKSCSIDEIKNAIEKVMMGKTYFSDCFQRKINNNSQNTNTGNSDKEYIESLNYE